MKQLTLCVGASAFALMLSAPAHAYTIEVVGSFGDGTPSDTPYFEINRNQDNTTSGLDDIPVNTGSPTDSVAYFGWGIDIVESWATWDKIQSHFWFNGTGSIDGATANPLLGDIFSLGNFTYTNEETILSGGTVVVDFSMDIAIDGVALSPLTYSIEINNTPNDHPGSSFDTAELISEPGDVLFSLGGTDYYLSILGFTRDGGLNYENYAELAEDAQTSAEIYAKITAVPVPAAVWLMASGLLGLIGIARKR